MRRLIFGLVMSIILGSALSPSKAQDNSGYSAQNTMQTISGSVVSSDDKNLTITTDSGRQMEFSIDPSAGIPASLQAGSRVDVTFLPQSDGKFEATKVALSSATDRAGVDNSGSMPENTTTASTYDNPTGGGAEGGGTTHAAPQGTDRTRAMTNTGTQSRTLPGTASSLPLVGITGLIALGGALALRLIWQRS